MIEAGTSLSDAIRRATGRLSQVGVEDARLDARRLLMAATGVSQEQLMLDPARPLRMAEAALFSAFIERRITREPVTRILGERSFYGRVFEVTPATLDPRPETETLVELALDIAAAEGWRQRRIEIWDLGTGTGCLLLTLLAELPLAHGLGTDVSAATLEVARRNAARHGLQGVSSFEIARGVEGISSQFDLVVSNPPYIPSAEIADLDPEVRDFDPRLALDGGDDGLDILREIVGASGGQAFADRTWFIVEIGAGQATALIDLIAAHCGPKVARAALCRADFGGHTRCVAWKPQI